MKAHRSRTHTPEDPTPSRPSLDAGSRPVAAGIERKSRAEKDFIDHVNRRPEAHIRRHPDCERWVVCADVNGRQVRLEFVDRHFGNALFAFDAAVGWRNAQTWYELSWGGRNSVNPVRRYECHLAGSAIVRAVWYASGVDAAGEKWIERFPVDTWGEEIAMHKAKDVHDIRAWERDAAPRPRPPALRLRRTRPNRNNRTGIIGVSRVVRRSDSGRSTHPGWPYWYARWTDENGISRIRTFSVSKLGEDSARQLAIDTRRKEAARIDHILRERMAMA